MSIKPHPLPDNPTWEDWYKYNRGQGYGIRESAQNATESMLRIIRRDELFEGKNRKLGIAGV